MVVVDIDLFDMVVVVAEVVEMAPRPRGPIVVHFGTHFDHFGTHFDHFGTHFDPSPIHSDPNPTHSDPSPTHSSQTPPHHSSRDGYWGGELVGGGYKKGRNHDRVCKRIAKTPLQP